MAHLPKRVGELSSDRCRLLERMLVGVAASPSLCTDREQGPAKAGVPEAINSHKGECRQFYDRRLDASIFGGGHFLGTDAMPADRFAECSAFLRRTGFTLELDRDITANVASCVEIVGDRMMAYDAQSLRRYERLSWHSGLTVL